MSLPYTIQIRPVRDQSGEYCFATVAELDGCQSQSDGKTFSETYKSVREAIEGYIQVKLDFGDLIPEPGGQDEFNG